MDYYDGRSYLFGQPGATHEGLAGIETPGALVERRVQGKNRDAVPVGQVGQIGVLVGVPALVHHDLHTVVPCFGRPTVSTVQAEGVQRTGAEDYRYRH